MSDQVSKEERERVIAEEAEARQRIRGMVQVTGAALIEAATSSISSDFWRHVLERVKAGEEVEVDGYLFRDVRDVILNNNDALVLLAAMGGNAVTRGLDGRAVTLVYGTDGPRVRFEPESWE
jgi:hypothetical protein